MVTRTEILIARHGEVSPAYRGTIYGRLDVPLSEVGERQSEALARALADVRLDAVVSSGLARAETAAAHVRRGRGLDRVDEPRLLEMDRGAWAGVAIESLAADDPDGLRRWREHRGAVAGPGGESPQEVAHRVIPALQELAAQYAGGRVLVVAHMWVVRSAVCHSLGIHMSRSPAVGLQPGSVAALSWPTNAAIHPALISLGAGSRGALSSISDR